VVDDEAAVRDICLQALEAFGYQVELAGDGAEGVEIYRRAHEEGRPFALVLMDLTMPRMDGRAAAKAIGETDPGVRIVITSGRGSDRQLMEDFRPQPKGLLQKPFDLGALLLQVNRVLSE
jgi:two-component system cell cycle sensor histidine kinase/response regulator CckA